MASGAATAPETNSIIREMAALSTCITNAVRCSLFDDDYTSVRTVQRTDDEKCFIPPPLD
jgi:hypothetical protein